MKDAIAAGLISGAIVTLSVIVFRSFWKSVVVPWFEDRVYKDARIEGKWFSLYPGDQPYRQETIVLERRGHAIRGTMICTNGADEGDSYSLSGSFRNLLLPLIYESSDRSRIDRGTITLRSTDDGRGFSGRLAAYGSQDDEVFSARVVWFRSKDRLDRTVKRMLAKRDEIERAAEKETADVKEMSGIVARLSKSHQQSEKVVSELSTHDEQLAGDNTTETEKDS